MVIYLPTYHILAYYGHTLIKGITKKGSPLGSHKKFWASKQKDDRSVYKFLQQWAWLKLPFKCYWEHKIETWNLMALQTTHDIIYQHCSLKLTLLL